jgi:hypothetical protein
MADLSNFNSQFRQHRVKLLGSVLAMVQVNDDRLVRARMHQLSISGGVLQIPDAIEESANVRLIFHVGSTTMRTEAQMLSPMWSTRAYLQPFRFTGLGVEDRERLGRDLEKLKNRGIGHLVPLQPLGYSGDWT